jgi:hypothetical protein
MAKQLTTTITMRNHSKKSRTSVQEELTHLLASSEMKQQITVIMTRNHCLKDQSLNREAYKPSGAFNP